VKQEELTRRLAANIYEYIQEDYSLTSEEVNQIMEIIADDEFSLMSLPVMVSIINDAHERLPTNVIPFE
jgi:hypothetical protein